MIKNLSIKSASYILIGTAVFSSIALSGCSQIKNNSSVNQKTHNYNINTKEVEKAQDAWAKGLVNIGTAYLNKGNYKQEAKNVINNLYAYNYGQNIVLFKPTKAKDTPFRSSYESALSYFIGGNIDYSEDKGFAIEPWKSIKFQNDEIYTHHGLAIAMGEYIFTNYKGGTAKVEYTFGYIKDNNNNLRIILHHSSLPYPG
jgi:hypothetical protein